MLRTNGIDIRSDQIAGIIDSCEDRVNRAGIIHGHRGIGPMVPEKSMAARAVTIESDSLAEIVHAANVGEQ